MRNGFDCNYKCFFYSYFYLLPAKDFEWILVWEKTHLQILCYISSSLWNLPELTLLSLYICGIKRELFTWCLSTASWENRKHPIVCLTGKKYLNIHNMFLKNNTGPGYIIVPYMPQCSYLWGTSMLSTSRPETQMQHCFFTLSLDRFCLHHH